MAKLIILIIIVFSISINCENSLPNSTHKRLRASPSRRLSAVNFLGSIDKNSVLPGSTSANNTSTNIIYTWVQPDHFDDSGDESSSSYSNFAP